MTEDSFAGVLKNLTIEKTVRTARIAVRTPHAGNAHVYV